MYPARYGRWMGGSGPGLRNAGSGNALQPEAGLAGDGAVQRDMKNEVHQRKRIAFWPLALALCGTMWLTGCAIELGSGQHDYEPTVGQELLDLKRAYDAGAIDQHEYEAKKADLMYHHRR